MLGLQLCITTPPPCDTGDQESSPELRACWARTPTTKPIPNPVTQLSITWEEYMRKSMLGGKIYLACKFRGFWFRIGWLCCFSTYDKVEHQSWQGVGGGASLTSWWLEAEGERKDQGKTVPSRSIPAMTCFPLGSPLGATLESFHCLSKNNPLMRSEPSRSSHLPTFALETSP